MMNAPYTRWVLSVVTGLSAASPCSLRCATPTCSSSARTSEAGCRSRDADVPELFAGFEYGATIVLSNAMN